MKARPILFSGPMIRALLEGRKTQTRRPVKLPDDAREVKYYAPPSGRSQQGWADPGVNYWTERGNHIDPCPYGQPGDLLWVRETWATDAPSLDDCRRGVESDGVAYGPYYRATASDFDVSSLRWRPSIHMPRFASRLTLEITDVRVQRLRDISEEDAKAEGAEKATPTPDGYVADADGTCLAGFEALWDSINAKRGFGWDANPWIWALTFKVHQINVDEFLRRAA